MLSMTAVVASQLELPTGLTSLQRVEIQSILKAAFNFREGSQCVVDFLRKAFLNHLTKVVHQPFNLIFWKGFKDSVNGNKILKIDASLSRNLLELFNQLCIKAFDATLR